MKEADITEHEKTIADLRSKIQDLQRQLDNAMLSGSEATQQLRKQLQEVTEAFEKFRNLSKQEYASLQESLADKHRRELDQQKEKYERML